MHRIFIVTAASFALLLSACSITPEDAQTATDSQSPGAASPRAAAQPNALGGTSVTGADLAGGKKGDALNDPAGLLAKRTIYYDYERFEIKDEYRPIVEAHAKYLRDHRGSKVMIEGNADERGGREYNVGLGQRRSDSVKQMLLLLGAREDQVEAVSLGEEKPVCTEQTEACWGQNRRGDIRYTTLQ